MAACAAVVLLTASAAPAAAAADPVPALTSAQHLFYSGRYEEAAAMALATRAVQPDVLESYELRTSALHFQVKRLLEQPAYKGKGVEKCVPCGPLLTEFDSDITRGVALARARLMETPGDESAMFLLGKLNLNYVWLQLGTLGRKTGWGQYWEGRKTLDDVLKAHPDNVRARVARAWIDYIVDTKLPRGTKWLLGGGNKKKGLAIVREAAKMPADPYVQAEAIFALWDMQVRERNPDAINTARELLKDYPENQELVKFIAKASAP
jgi:tetratricopeptide (TPR) repeat protein